MDLFVFEKHLRFKIEKCKSLSNNQSINPSIKQMKSKTAFALIISCTIFCISSCQNQSAHISNTAEDYSIIPKPMDLQIEEGRFLITPKTTIASDHSLVFEGDYLAGYLSEISACTIHNKMDGNGKIKLTIDSSFKFDEEYKLSVTQKNVLISAKTPQGIFYGIQTLKQLILPLSNESDSKTQLGISAVSIHDSPRFDYRGMHLDVCRHFFSVDFIKKYLDVLAFHKINTFHWHLTEDQGWRIEIKKYPKLTEVAAWRNGTIEGHYPGNKNDNQKYGGYYTQEQIKEIVAYAKDRHITVIPEIELPGHSSAAIAAYPALSCFPDEPTIIPNEMASDASLEAQAQGQMKLVQESWGVYHDVYCAGKEGTFQFVEDVLDEVMALFPSEFIHIGGDECPKGNWKRCTNCQKRIKEKGLKDEHELQSYFIRRVEEYVNSKGRKIIGWDEILEGGLAPKASVMSWRGNKGGIAAAKAGHTVVMSPNSHCYFDHYQSDDYDNEPLAIGGYLPLEKVYSFDPIPDKLDSAYHKYILGGQANLWTEYIPTEEQAEYMLLPRLTALSEALWTQKENKDWKEFTDRIEKFKRHYSFLNLNYAKHIFEEAN